MSQPTTAMLDHEAETRVLLPTATMQRHIADVREE